eukprot:scaffold16998_cov59-Phaeocystis_antarctica.AAC.3
MTVRRWCAAAQGSVPCLNGQRRWNQRLCRRLARAPEAVAERPEGRLLPGSPELPRAARRALRRHRSRAGALPRGHFDYAAVQGGLREDQAVARRLLGFEPSVAYEDGLVDEVIELVVGEVGQRGRHAEVGLVRARHDTEASCATG